MDDIIEISDRRVLAAIGAVGSDAFLAADRAMRKELKAELAKLEAQLREQPAPAAQGPLTPLTDEQIVAESDRPCYQSEAVFDWFEAGVRFAERAHGITGAKT